MANILLEKMQEFFPNREAELRHICTYWKVQKIEIGENLYSKKVPLGYIGFVNSGMLRVSYHDKGGSEMTLYFAHEGHFVTGDAHTDLKSTGLYQLEAIEESVCYILDPQSAEEVFVRYKWFEKFAKNDLLIFGKEILQKLIAMKLQPLESRYRLFLEDNPGLENRIPLHFVADYLGILPQALSRIRRQMAASNRV